MPARSGDGRRAPTRGRGHKRGRDASLAFSSASVSRTAARPASGRDPTDITLPAQRRAGGSGPGGATGAMDPFPSRWIYVGQWH